MFVAMTVHHWVIWQCLGWRTCVSLSLLLKELPPSSASDGGGLNQLSMKMDRLTRVGLSPITAMGLGQTELAIISVLSLFLSHSPAHHCIGDHWCHHSLRKSREQWPAHTERSQPARHVKATLTPTYRTSQSCRSGSVYLSEHPGTCMASLSRCSLVECQIRVSCCHQSLSQPFTILQPHKLRSVRDVVGDQCS